MSNVQDIHQALDRALAPSSNGKGPTDPKWPAPPAEEAFQRLAGEFCRGVAEQSEADPAALLAHYLVVAGNLFGTGSYYQVEGDRHPARLFVAIIGATSKARKGTAWGRVRQVAEGVDPDWPARIVSGLGSGEGVVWAVRDQIIRKVPVKDAEGKKTGEFEEEIEDPGVEDKRLLVVEAEFSRHFDVIARSGSTLSETVRRLWDGGVVSSLTKNSPVRATDPHVSIIGHISREELLQKATDTEFANGFLNRFLIVASRRSKLLPFGGELDLDELRLMTHHLGVQVEKARQHQGQISWEKKAAEHWQEIYGPLSAERPGMVGAVTARAEAQVVRLAVCYMLLDGCRTISLEHLKGALAFWEYCARSAEWAFGDSTGDPVADSIHDALQRAEAGLTKTEIRDLFHRNYPKDRIDTALLALTVRQLVTMEHEESSGGRPAERWHAK